MSSRSSYLLQKELDNADTYDQWRDIAMRIDQIEGRDKWKTVERTNLYDYQAIRSRYNILREMRESGDDHGLLFALNEGIHGNMGGMGSAELFKKTRFGTKQLINDYIDEVTNALYHLASPKVDSISIDEKLEFFNRAAHCFGRSALMLSGSGSLFYFHLGVVKALWEEGLLPSVISGASGGAIVAAIVGSHSHEELETIFDAEHLKIQVEQGLGLRSIGNLLSRGHVSPKAIEEFLVRIIPDLTFQEAAARTGIHINVSVAPVQRHQTSRLLNDIASPNVMLREALMASSAFPGFFPPVTLAAKDRNGNRKPYLPNRKWIDGSVSDDLPIKRVMRLYGVNHSIVSQTNPVALPFISENHSATVFGILKETLQITTKQWALAGAKIIGHPMKLNSRLSQLLTFTSSVLAQTYTGDINILPPRRLHNPAQLLSQRTNAEIIELIRHGERATWPKIEAIRVQTKISNALDTIAKNLEAELLNQVHESSIAERKTA
ncbi:MAG: DUF3336 domain-containing protein [Porticoccaceae bacterium]|nr:DUF3336 domain-containing protein [Porticoccaceae bacterium]